MSFQAFRWFPVVLAVALIMGSGDSLAQHRAAPRGVRVIEYPGDVSTGYATPLGVVRVTCDGPADAGRVRYMVDRVVLAERPAENCNTEWGTPQLVYEAVYANGERLLAVTLGSGTAGTTGPVIRLAAGQPPRVVGSDYMLEWADLQPTADRLRFSAGGVGSGGEMEYWVCEMRVDWSTGRMVGMETVSGPDNCAAGDGTAQAASEPAPLGGGWRLNETRDHAFILEQSSVAALAVSCYESFQDPPDWFVVFGVPNGYDVTTTLSTGDRTSTLSRFFDGVTIMRLTARASDSSPVAVLQLERLVHEGGAVWQVVGSRAQISAVIAADRIDLQTNRWSALFHAGGSGRRLAELSCSQD